MESLAEDNDSEGIWEVEAPTDDDLMEGDVFSYVQGGNIEY